MSDRPYVSFRQIKERISLPQVLDVLGIRENFVERNGSLTGACPLPEHVHGPKPNERQFRIDCRDSRWLWFCYGDCSRGSDVIGFVKAMCGLSDAHARLWFAEHFADQIDVVKPKVAKGAKAKKEARKDTGESDSEQASRTVPMNLPNGSKPLKPLRFYLNLQVTHPYLADRGVHADTARRYGVGFCSKGLMAGYIAVPLYRYPRQSEDEHPVGYIGRWAGEDYEEVGVPRYKLPEGFEAGRMVFGLAEALQTPPERPLVVVEGPFKVFHLYQCGFANVVSTLTSNVSEDQAEILGSTGRHVVILFDGDEAGRMGAERAVKAVSPRAFVRQVRLADSKEADDLADCELKEELSF